MNYPQISASISLSGKGSKLTGHFSSCQRIIKEDESKISEEEKNERSNSETLTREMILDINVNGKLAVAIVEASSIFKMTLQQIVNISFL